MFIWLKKKLRLRAIKKRLERLKLEMTVTSKLWDKRRQDGNTRGMIFFYSMYLREKARYLRLSEYELSVRHGRIGTMTRYPAQSF